jgi:hypothetical protein
VRYPADASVTYVAFAALRASQTLVEHDRQVDVLRILNFALAATILLAAIFTLL